MKILKYIPILTLFLCSCINMHEPADQARFIEARKSYSDTLVSHIPKKLPNNLIGLSYSAVASKWSNGGMKMKVKYHSLKKFYKIKEEYKKSIHIKSTDPCIFTIEDGLLEREILTPSQECNSTYPIPQYLFYKYENEELVKEEDFEIYLLDFEPGVYIQKEKLNENFEYPINWIHGLSRGIAFYEDKLIISYWLIIW